MIACYYLISWLKQNHFTPTSVVPLELFFSVRISPSYWRRSNIWNWIWLQRRHNKFKDYFWSNWSTKKYKIGGTNSIRGWTLTMSICHFFTWTHFSTGSGGELVNCGGHTATSCGECPEGNGYVERPESSLLLLRAWKEWERQRWNHLFSFKANQR